MNFLTKLLYNDSLFSVCVCVCGFFFFLVTNRLHAKDCAQLH